MGNLTENVNESAVVGVECEEVGMVGHTKSLVQTGALEIRVE